MGECEDFLSRHQGEEWDEKKHGEKCSKNIGRKFDEYLGYKVNDTCTHKKENRVCTIKMIFIRTEPGDKICPPRFQYTFDDNGKKKKGHMTFENFEQDWKNTKDTIMIKEYIDLLKSNKNLILTGAPGTGKTYLAKQIAKSIILEFRDTGGVENQDIVKESIKPFLEKDIDYDNINQVDEIWQFWKNRIISEDFCIDDYANTKKNVEDSKDIDRLENGYYLANFLERKSKIYGSSRPGNALQYGIKMNNDNQTYTTYANQDEKLRKDYASEVFNKKVGSWLKDLVTASYEEKVKIAENGNELIKAGQLIRKMIVLEHPDKLLYIYQDDTIKRAYNYFVKGNETEFCAQNEALVNYILDKYSIERSKDNVLRLTWFVWDYFRKDGNTFQSETNSNSTNEIEEKFFEERLEFVQFHPSYDYTDFVEGLRPVRKDDSELGFELKDGVFKTFCKKALQDKENKFVMIIDEINRAEISKVFGELFFSIDPGYRGKSGKVKTQYSNLQDIDDVFSDGFYIPENVFILGTMNDIDRSVECMDFAMRRRFAWKEVKAVDRIEMWDGQIDKWKKEAKSRMCNLNQSLEEIQGLSSAYHIGPAYFLKLKSYNGDFNELWENHLRGVMFEYLRGLPNSEELLDNLKSVYDNSILDA